MDKIVLKYLEANYNVEFDKLLHFNINSYELFKTTQDELITFIDLVNDLVAIFGISDEISFNLLCEFLNSIGNDYILNGGDKSIIINMRGIIGWSKQMM